MLRVGVGEVTFGDDSYDEEQGCDNQQEGQWPTGPNTVAWGHPSTVNL